MEDNMPAEDTHNANAAERHLLIAISNDASALHGVKFVSGFFSDFSNVRVTLFASLPSQSPTAPSESALESRKDILDMRAKLRDSFATALMESRAILEQAGMDPERIDEKSVPSIHSTDFHLALEGERGMYDVLVLGRRGLETFTQIFEDSTTERLLQNEELSLPCWACRQYRPGRKGILLCLDKAPGLSDLVEHVGSVCALAPDHDVTLFHVCGPREDRAVANSIFSETIELLAGRGVPGERVQVAFAEGSVPARTILRKAQEGRYAAVALGRQGAPGHRIRKLFNGSTSKSLLCELTGAAAWFAG